MSTHLSAMQCTPDIAVIGGGPAGAVTALLLARAGAGVLLYERSHYDALRLGETLPPSVNPLLRELGLWDQFRALGALASHETASAWGGRETAERSFLFSPHGHGWHVERARFDRMLADAAEEAGAKVLRGCHVSAVSRHGTGFHVDAQTPAAGSPVHVGAVIDATGRSARIARGLGASRDQLDQLVCAARVFAVDGQPPGDTFIEAVPAGWWYVSPLPEARRLIALFTDARHLVAEKLATDSGWCDALERTDHTRALALGIPQGEVCVRSCASHELCPAVGHDWIAVGDAALAVDPLSSGGVAFAFRSAVAAAQVVLSGDSSTYEIQVATAARDYREQRGQIYAWEQRFSDNDFWRARAG